MKEGWGSTDMDVFTCLPPPLELHDHIVTSGRHSLQPRLSSRTRAVAGLTSSRGEEEKPTVIYSWHKVIILACVAVRSPSLKSERPRRKCSWLKRGAEIEDYSLRVWRVHSRTSAFWDVISRHCWAFTNSVNKLKMTKLSTQTLYIRTIIKMYGS